MTLRLELTAGHWAIVALITFMSVAAAIHALLYKRDPRAAFGWVAVCLLFPALGPALYFLFGINRIRIRALAFEAAQSFHADMGHGRARVQERFAHPPEALPEEFVPIARVSSALETRPLIGGNSVEPLFNGEEAYPAMIGAVREATRSVFLSAFIFQRDGIGTELAATLGAARARGVDVRVLVDGIGELYGLTRRIRPLLERLGVRVARFLPPRLLPPSIYVNLRNHRKVLVVDGRVGFTGGMNIADRHRCAEPPPPSRASDVHFRVRGPVVAQLEHAFLQDWRFATGDTSVPEPAHLWSPDEAPGSAYCRVIVEGPNEKFDKLATVLNSAIAAASERVVIVTPYFLPERQMIAVLQTAALRGVSVTLVLPERNNLPYVHWATRNMLWELLEMGVQICYQPPPFAHSKLFLVDDFYAQVGSANLDPRSLRLNFELNVEVFDRALVRDLSAHVDEVRRRSRPVTLEEVDGRPFLVHTRDAVCWLFMPYL